MRNDTEETQENTTRFYCESREGVIYIGRNPTWFGQPLISYIELICDKCHNTYSRDIRLIVRPDVSEVCVCGEPMPQMRYIEQM